MNSDLLYSFGKMFPDSSLPTEGETLEQCSWRWTESGIVEHGQCLMLGGLVSHSADGAFSACSLAEILLPDVAPKYWLSARAARGILRRAAKRGRELPPQLHQALAALAGTEAASSLPSPPAP